MSSTLRLSIIMVLLLATAALGLIAYTNMNPKPVVQVTENTPTPAPPTGRYFVAARPLPAGTEARDEVLDRERRRRLLRDLHYRDLHFRKVHVVGNEPERSGCEQQHHDDRETQSG